MAVEFENKEKLKKQKKVFMKNLYYYLCMRVGM